MKERTRCTPYFVRVGVREERLSLVTSVLVDVLARQGDDLWIDAFSDSPEAEVPARILQRAADEHYQRQKESRWYRLLRKQSTRMHIRLDPNDAEDVVAFRDFVLQTIDAEITVRIGEQTIFSATDTGTEVWVCLTEEDRTVVEGHLAAAGLMFEDLLELSPR